MAIKTKIKKGKKLPPFMKKDEEMPPKKGKKMPMKKGKKGC